MVKKLVASRRRQLKKVYAILWKVESKLLKEEGLSIKIYKFVITILHNINYLKLPS
jgi:hypothetical protein